MSQINQDEKKIKNFDFLQSFVPLHERSNQPRQLFSPFQTVGNLGYYRYMSTLAAQQRFTDDFLGSPYNCVNAVRNTIAKFG